MNVIILAAGQGTRLLPYTYELPKCMVQLHQKPLLFWQLETIRSIGINDIVIVGGYQYKQIDAPGTELVINPEYTSTNMVQSLWCARDYFGEEFIMCYGDIVYNSDILKRLSESTGDICVVIDKSWKPYWKLRSGDILTDAESLTTYPSGNIRSIGQKGMSLDSIEGQYIGMVAFRNEGVRKVRELLQHTERYKKAYMTDLLQTLINEGVTVQPLWIEGGWLEVDTVRDLNLALLLSVVEDNHLRIRSSII